MFNFSFDKLVLTANENWNLAETVNEYYRHRMTRNNV